MCSAAELQLDNRQARLYLRNNNKRKTTKHSGNDWQWKVYECDTIHTRESERGSIVCEAAEEIDSLLCGFL